MEQYCCSKKSLLPLLNKVARPGKSFRPPEFSSLEFSDDGCRISLITGGCDVSALGAGKVLTTRDWGMFMFMP